MRLSQIGSVASDLCLPSFYDPRDKTNWKILGKAFDWPRLHLMLALDQSLRPGKWSAVIDQVVFHHREGIVSGG